MNCQRNGFKLQKLKTNLHSNILSIFNTALEWFCYPKSGFQTNQKLKRVLTNRNAMAGGKIYDKWEKGGKSTTNVEKCTTHKRARVVREVSFEAQTAQISLSVPLATGEPPTTRMSEEIEIIPINIFMTKGDRSVSGNVKWLADWHCPTNAHTQTVIHVRVDPVWVDENPTITTRISDKIKVISWKPCLELLGPCPCPNRRCVFLKVTFLYYIFSQFVLFPTF